MLAAVVKLKPTGIKRPRGHIRYRSSGITGAPGDGRLDFPMAYLPRLFQRASNQRDRAYWLLLAAGGLRSHEAEQLRILARVWKLLCRQDRQEESSGAYLCSRFNVMFLG